MTETTEPACGLLSSVNIRFVLVEYKVCCTVAPRKESTYTRFEQVSGIVFDSLLLTNDPRPPESSPKATKVTKGCMPKFLQAGFSSSSSRLIVSPIMPPPAIETAVPRRDMAPFVPGGTCFKVVTRIGFDFDKMPSSEASVSPKLHPNYWAESGLVK